MTVAELGHLQPPCREAALLPDAERVHWLRQERWIQYPRAERILDRLMDLVDYPPRDRMPCLVIYGATGMGKTRIIQKFLRDNRAHFDKKLGRTRLPVVSIQMPPSPSERDLYEEILAAMGGIFTYGTSVTALRHRIRALARQLEVRLLVIDEIHSLLAGTYREQRILLNSIRFLANDLRLPLVCSGTHEAKQALMTDQQLADRFEAAELPAWENDSNFHQLLLSFESILPLRLPSEFRDPKVHQRILSLSEGVLVRICRLIETAATEAIHSGQEHISPPEGRLGDGIFGLDRRSPQSACVSPMTTASAPPQLPFAQRPFANELLSSWLMRVADANCVSLEELMLGFQCRHPELPCPASLDWNLPQSFLKAMARFCRTSGGTLRALDIKTRLPEAETALLLRSKADSDQCPRLRDKRTGYAFCLTCITEQPYVHVRWEWAFPALLRCHIHKIPLRHGCHLCGEDDPLPFGTAPVRDILCQRCGANLTCAERGSHAPHLEEAHVFIERIYRAALRGAAPRAALLGQATCNQFRRFVDDLLQLLAWYPDPELSTRFTDPQNQYLPFRTAMVAVVGALVRNAAPESKPIRMQIRYREGLKLWLSVLSLLSRREETWVEAASEHWPSALRRRLRAALDHHERASAQRSPFRSTFFRPGLKYINRFQFRDLRAVNEVEHRNSRI